MIVVTGAAGKTGQAIIQAVGRRGAEVRAFVSRPDHVPLVEALGAAEVVVGRLEDEAAVAQAVQGGSALYLICPNMHPDELALGQIAIDAARRAGVARFVYHSVLHPQTEKMPHHWHKLRVEERLFEAGLDFTILQPAAYMQNILGGWSTIVETGLYRVPYPPDTRLAMVDLEDVAEVAAGVLTEPGHSQAIYELAGPEAPTQTEVAELLSQLLNRPVRVEQTPLETWAEGARAAGLGSYAVETLLKMFRYYDQYGFQGNANVLRWLLGRPPTTFPAFVRRVTNKE